MQSYDIQVINTAARTLFGIHGSALGQDLIHLVRTLPASDVRAAVDQAMRGATASLACTT